MNRIHSVLSVSGLTLAMGAALIPGTAQAQTIVTRTEMSNPTNYCQAALPVFDGNVRKRPLAVQNEGSGNAFITCNFNTQGGAITDVVVYFASSNTSSLSVTCTGVNSYNTGANEYIVKTAALNGTGGQNFIAWSASDFSGAPAYIPDGLFGISCNLLPGVGINDSYVIYDEDVGS